MIILLFLGFAVTALFVMTQYKDSVKEIETRISYELTKKVVLKGNEILALFSDWENNIHTVASDQALPQAVQVLAKAFQEYQPSKQNEKSRKDDLKKFIQTNLLPTLQARQSDVDIQTLLSKDPKTVDLQNIFVVQKSDLLGEVQDSNSASESSNSYIQVHELYHPYFLSFKEQIGADDLLLVDPESGDIFYTVQKEIDFANNLSSDLMSKSNLAKLFQTIKTELKQEIVQFVDLKFYIPSAATPYLFLGIPIYLDGKVISILFLKYGLSRIDEIMGSSEGLEKSVGEDRYLVGPNFLMHSNSYLYAADPQAYLKNLTNANTPQNIIEKIEAYNSTALILEEKTPAVLQGLTGTQGIEELKNALGRDLLVGFAPINLKDFNMVSVATLDKGLALQQIRFVSIEILSTILGLFLLILFFSIFLLRINMRLEGLVVEKTGQLEKEKNTAIQALAALKSTQTKLVQSEKMASLGVLTAGIAHEINNPITFIVANVRSLESDFNDLVAVIKSNDKNTTDTGANQQTAEVANIDVDETSAEIKQLLVGMKDGANRTAAIVKDLRTFARLDESDLKKVNLEDGLEATLVLMRSQYEGRIDIKKEFGNIPEIECYPGEVNQVFMNVLSNAFLSIHQNGVVTIKTEKIDGSVSVRIKDTGTGMNEETRIRVFEPFFTTRDVGKGTGLGLSVSLGVINAHGGTIEATSELGVGSEFIITLPIRRSAELTQKA